MSDTKPSNNESPPGSIPRHTDEAITALLKHSSDGATIHMIVSASPHPRYESAQDIHGDEPGSWKEYQKGMVRSHIAVQYDISYYEQDYGEKEGTIMQHAAVQRNVKALIRSVLEQLFACNRVLCIKLCTQIVEICTEFVLKAEASVTGEEE